MHGNLHSKNEPSCIQHMQLLKCTFIRPFCSSKGSRQKKLDLCIPRKGTAQPQSQFPHSWVYERFPRSVHLFYCSRKGRPIVGICTVIRTQKHECRNWDCDRAIPFLGIYVSNSWNCVFAVLSSVMLS
jgi:hypothetical protein